MSEPKRIQLKRSKGFKLPPNTVVVSRPSRFGNPFRVAKRLPARLGMGEYATAQEAVSRFVEFLNEAELDGEPIKEVIRRELRGKNLACWCKLSEICHADVLIAISNA